MPLLAVMVPSVNAAGWEMGYQTQCNEVIIASLGTIEVNKLGISCGQIALGSALGKLALPKVVPVLHLDLGESDLPSIVPFIPQ
jgi:hypothetical protein